ncbi:MAG: methyltransferase [Proteobacteria bacterium]|nr:MAG: methyltransferase [Pseudomonadota bacterium]
MLPITDPTIQSYCLAHSTPPPKIFRDLPVPAYAAKSAPNMQVGALEAGLLRLLVAISAAKRVLEFGTFSGYSALAMAEALPPEGELITCDIDPRVREYAVPFWAKSAAGNKIHLEIGPGAEVLHRLQGPFDLIFIDADKAGYQNYWDACLPLLREGGIIVVDNVLWAGRVLDPSDKSSQALKRFNEYAARDARVELLMLPIGDGILLGRKRPLGFLGRAL